MKFSTLQTLCQELFQVFFKLFCSVIRRVFQLCRCLADSLVILSRAFSFVNAFFHFFLHFFAFGNCARLNPHRAVPPCAFYSKAPASVSRRLSFSPQYTYYIYSFSLYRLPDLSTSTHAVNRNNFFFLFINSIHPYFPYFFPPYSPIPAHPSLKMTKIIILPLPPLLHLHSFRLYDIIGLASGFL